MQNDEAVQHCLKKIMSSYFVKLIVMQRDIDFQQYTKHTFLMKEYLLLF